MRGVYGWAWVPDHPQRAVSLKAIYNDKNIGETQANLFRNDLLENNIGTGYYGFNIIFNVPIYDIDNLVIFAKSGEDEIRPNIPPLTFVEGFVEIATPTEVSGWAWFPGTPDIGVPIEILVDGDLVGRVVCNMLRPDLIEARGGSGRYGFKFVFTHPLAQDQLVQVYAKDLHGSQKLLFERRQPAGEIAYVMTGSAPVEEPVESASPALDEVADEARPFSLKIDGEIQALNRWGVRGWARSESESNSALEVEAYVNGKSIGRGLANQPRASDKDATGFDIAFDRPVFGHTAPSLRIVSEIVNPRPALPGWTPADLDKLPTALAGASQHAQDLVLQSQAVRFAARQNLVSLKNLRSFPGKREERRERPRVLLVAHFVGDYAFGSERSFIDMIDALDAMQYNVIVVLPRNNPDYTNLIRAKVLKVLIINYGWWRDGVDIDYAIVAKFKQVLLEERISAVHINTIMVREGAIAARGCDIPAVVHVRELVTHDAQLCNLIGQDAEEIIAEVKRRADWIVANSLATADAFHKANATFVVPNTIAVDAFAAIPPRAEPTLRIGLISSNIEKKGVEDFAELARLAALDGLDAEFLLIGPETELIKSLIRRQLENDDLRLLKFPGYAKTPEDAIAQVDVVVNFSHFSESFGRTVLEAMAARRPVIAYAWGALSELIQHGKNGYLIPYRRSDAALPHIRGLCVSRELVREIGEQGHHFARKFDVKFYKENLAAAYARILPGDANKSPSASPTILAARAKPSRIDSQDGELRLAYFCWHFPVPSETFVLAELEELKARGVDVIVFCRQSPHKTFKPAFDIDYYQVKSVDDLAERLRATRRNMVHAHFVFPTVTNMVWPACEKTQTPFTFIAHAQDVFVYKNMAQARLDEIGQSPYCIRLFTLSEFHRDHLHALGFPLEKIAINPNAVTVKPQYFSSEKYQIKKKIVAVHRLVEKKGLHLLIKAASILTDLDVDFEIYGYGELENEFRDLIQALKLSRVKLMGPIPHDDVMRTIQSGDLFASPCVRTASGDMDGIPTSVVESMIAGTPVLTTAAAGLPDLVVDEITGIVCEPDAASVASAIRRFYAMDSLKRRFMIENARARALARHDSSRTVDVLTRVWRGEGVDVVIVSWNNVKELQMVVDRVLANTALPLHLIVCDNNSQKEPVQEFLQHVWRKDDRVTVVLNTANAMVGPGTNLAADQGASETIIYVCGKEGVSFASGWELPFVRAFAADPRVGLAGTIGYSPSYLTGAQYPQGVRLFEDFRNKEFAARNPNRIFGHIQGGLFAFRRSMYNEIGGFSEATPHDYTDVEYSFYAESRGWKLAEPEGVLALFNKTRPTLSQRFDENVLAAHPVLPEQLDNFEGVRRGRLRHCNMCDWFGNRFSPDGHCPDCLSSAQDRSLFRWLSESPFMYRRMIALCVGVTGQMGEVANQHFQGAKMGLAEFLSELKAKQRLPNRPKSAGLALVRIPRLSDDDLALVAQELRRILDTGAKSVFQVDLRDETQWDEWRKALTEAMKRAGHAFDKDVRFASQAVGLDYRPLSVFERLP
jgi:glycosyltransferase involved in cell wall biosynthesis